MKKKYSICFLIAIVTCLMALTIAYQMSYHHARMELEKETETEKNNPSVATEGEAFQSDIYYLQELNGFIAVYQHDKKTVFEYTDIRMEELPNDLAREIKEGKKLLSLEAVYGFLENYSS